MTSSSVIGSPPRSRPQAPQLQVAPAAPPWRKTLPRAGELLGVAIVLALALAALLHHVSSIMAGADPHESPAPARIAD
ncbi:MAG TPA: hypothetical protein VEQ58_10240 [Polyangiaceae bacterium]|nr:hypothetical protein [Polyangiaceae bacterium]